MSTKKTKKRIPTREVMRRTGFSRKYALVLMRKLASQGASYLKLDGPPNQPCYIEEEALERHIRKIEKSLQLQGAI